jgi:hypothetical protein
MNGVDQGRLKWGCLLLITDLNNKNKKEAGVENPAGVHHENGVKWKEFIYMVLFLKGVCV